MPKSIDEKIEDCRDWIRRLEFDVDNLSYSVKVYRELMEEKAKLLEERKKTLDDLYKELARLEAEKAEKEGAGGIG